jgi:glycerol kinase
MARAILEGITAEMAENIELIENLSGHIEKVRVSGGLTKFDLFNQMQADMYGKNVLRSEEGEATALGAWISAAQCLGLYDSFTSASIAASEGIAYEEFAPIPDHGTIYGELRRMKRLLYRSLREHGAYDPFASTH